MSTSSLAGNSEVQEGPKVLKPSIQYSDTPRLADPPKFQRRLPGAGTAFGRLPSSENGDYLGRQDAEPVTSSLDTSSASSGKKGTKYITETTV